MRHDNYELQAQREITKQHMLNAIKYRDCLSKAMQGDVESYKKLSVMCYDGSTGEREYKRYDAMVWFLMAEECGATGLDKRIFDLLKESPPATIQSVKKEATRLLKAIEMQKNDTQN